MLTGFGSCCWTIDLTNEQKSLRGREYLYDAVAEIKIPTRGSIRLSLTEPFD